VVFLNTLNYNYDDFTSVLLFHRLNSEPKMALMKVKGNLERLFDKSLNDLVRGIRNHKDDEAKYIAGKEFLIAMVFF
jgi:hypothetical protein